MSGRVARLQIEYSVPKADIPSSLIAKMSSIDEETRDLTARFKMFERDIRFYSEIGPSLNIRTPRLYYATGSATRGHLMLIEDLAPLREGDLGAGCSLEQAELIVDLLAGMHATFWDSRQLEDSSWLPPPFNPVIRDLVEEVGADSWRAFRSEFGRFLPRRLRSAGDRLATDVSVLKRLSEPPRTLVHGDVRINNIMFNTAGEPMAIIDWQTVMQARAPFDVASLFVTSLTPSDRRIAEKKLLPLYHQRLQQSGVKGYSFERCLVDYRLAVLNQFSQVIVLQALLKVGDKLDDSLADITGARLMAALVDLDVQRLLPSGSRFSHLLALRRKGLHQPSS